MRCVTAAHPAAIITDHSRCTRALSCLPMTSFACVRLLLHRRSSLVWCLLAIFNNVLSIDQLAKIHHARHGEAAPAIGGFSTSFCRRRSSSGSWTSGTARRRPGAQLGDAAYVVGGGVGRVCDDGVAPATGADGWGMQETSTPPPCRSRHVRFLPAEHTRCCEKCTLSSGTVKNFTIRKCPILLP